MTTIREKVPAGRVLSIDALRGFDMFWIIGGDGMARLLAVWVGTPAALAVGRQFVHAPWHGCRVEDIIFPLFLFIIGLSLPFSITKRLERGGSRRDLYRHILVRAAVLFFFGLVYNGLLRFDFETMRYAGVLQRLALGYLFASLIVMNTGIRGQAGWTAGILVGYWALMALVPVPGHGAGVYTPEGNLCAWIDRLFLPGRFYLYGDYQCGDATGMLSTIPAVASTMLGVLASHWLRSRVSGGTKVRGLVAAGAVCLVAALAWNTVFPINKAMWTSSFVLYAGGWSIMLLALFYWLVDVRGLRRWAFPFIVIGLNPITIYMGQRLIDFGHTAEFLFGGVVSRAGGLEPFLLAVSVFAVKWTFLYFLYKKGVFLKV